MRADLKVAPSILFSWPMMSEEDVGSLALEAELS